MRAGIQKNRNRRKSVFVFPVKEFNSDVAGLCYLHSYIQISGATHTTGLISSKVAVLTKVRS